MANDKGNDNDNCKGNGDGYGKRNGDLAMGGGRVRIRRLGKQWGWKRSEEQ